MRLRSVTAKTMHLRPLQRVPPPTRLAYREAVGRLLFMSWNAGGGARQLPTVLLEKECQVFAIQEAHVEQMLQLGTTHNVVLENEPVHCCPLAARG